MYEATASRGTAGSAAYHRAGRGNTGSGIAGASHAARATLNRQPTNTKQAEPSTSQRWETICGRGDVGLPRVTSLVRSPASTRLRRGITSRFSNAGTAAFGFFLGTTSRVSHSTTRNWPRETPARMRRVEPRDPGVAGCRGPGRHVDEEHGPPVPEHEVPAGGAAPGGRGRVHLREHARDPRVQPHALADVRHLVVGAPVRPDRTTRPSSPPSGRARAGRSRGRAPGRRAAPGACDAHAGSGPTGTGLLQ